MYYVISWSRIVSAHDTRTKACDAVKPGEYVGYSSIVFAAGALVGAARIRFIAWR